MAFARLPIEQLQAILDTGRHVDAPGVMLVRNPPPDPDLPRTPTDGGPSRDTRTFGAECVLPGLSQLPGEPVGIATESTGCGCRGPCRSLRPGPRCHAAGAGPP